ncbi:ENTH domain-containing protein [Aspergillus stella-maris]|uniref:ENTH domain-containing protein n=1 Tax=Aspergillus stella-maris TaxID=1810926 RepID=UPI003CCDCF87
MDFDSLKNQVSNLTLYDLKAGVRKVQNAVMNYTEMESKVREATNNEPWGASTTLMQEIATGTHHYQLLNEIMPMIYKRFTDKTSEEWRQIYKGLQLLEFLIKNGSERVVDDARSHLSLIRMLRQFHYIDPNGKDQGINVRNRAQELVKLLGDVELIRSERKKARTNRNKFRGFEGGAGIGGGIGGGIGSSGSGRYGGFGSDSLSFGGYSGGVYGDGGGFGGQSGDFGDAGGRRADRFDEYDEYDEADAAPARRRAASPPRAQTQAKKPEPPKAPAPDLVDFLDDDPAPAPAAAPSSVAAGKQPAGSNGLNMLDPTPADDDDDFDDFQSAPQGAPAQASSNNFNIPPPASTVSTTSTTQFAAPRPVSGMQGSNLDGIVGFTSMTPTPTSSGFTSPTLSSQAAKPGAQQPKHTGYQAATPNYFTSVASQGPSAGLGHRPGMASTSSFSSTASPATPSAGAGAKPAAKASGDAFGSLWSTASASAGIQKNNAAANKGPNLASMAKEKASAGIWGAPSSGVSSPAPSQPTQQQPKTGGSAFDDLLG